MSNRVRSFSVANATPGAAERHKVGGFEINGKHYFILSFSAVGSAEVEKVASISSRIIHVANQQQKDVKKIEGSTLYYVDLQAAPSEEKRMALEDLQDGKKTPFLLLWEQACKSDATAELIAAREMRQESNRDRVQQKLTKELQAAAEQQKGEKPRRFKQRETLDGLAPSSDKAREGAFSAKGQRDKLEDCHLVAQLEIGAEAGQERMTVRALFDGHGGRQTALYAKRHLVSHLKRRLEEMNRENLTDEGIWNALKLAIIDLNWAAKETKKMAMSGSTLNLILQWKRDLWCVNVGDSRAVLVDRTDGTTTQLSEDAKPEAERYRKSIEKRGGRVVIGKKGKARIAGGLAVGRALGDYRIKGVTARPKITKVSLESGHDYCVIQACDGIWDVCSTNQVGDWVLKCKELTPDALSRKLVEEAYRLGSMDNLTALVAFFP